MSLLPPDDDLEPLDGMQLPWEGKGLPRPCIDEPCQIEWMDEYLNAGLEPSA